MKLNERNYVTLGNPFEESYAFFPFKTLALIISARQQSLKQIKRRKLDILKYLGQLSHDIYLLQMLCCYDICLHHKK